MEKTVWTFGLISGGILSLMMLAVLPFQDAIGFDRGEIIGYTTIVAASLAVGALIGLIASACYVATWELVYFKLAPDFLAKYQAHMIAKAKASGASQADIEKKLADMQRFAEMYRNPAINAAITFVEPLPITLVFALASGA